MNKDHYLMYGAAIAAAAVAVWAGMPVVFLLFLACPLMMFFMMKGMSGMQSREAGSTPVPPQASPKRGPLEDVERP
jgi:Na+-transporting methylmalonyl-CoA/oxaloacetate decarboxylase gamma subunit